MYLCGMVAKDAENIELVSFNDIVVIGINSSLMDYKLAWSLNDALSLDFTRRNDFVSNGNVYPLYHCHLFENSPYYDLLSLNNGSETLLRFKPRLDYLLIIRNEPYLERIDNMLQKIKAMEGVSYAFMIEGQRSKIEPILYDIEQHEVDMLTLERERNTVEYAMEQIRKRDERLGMVEK